MAAVVDRIKRRLRTVSKLDTLSMPLRVSFIRVGAYRYDIYRDNAVALTTLWCSVQWRLISLNTQRY
jgi:hypothetical protein